jgi:hypothetical protein
MDQTVSLVLILGSAVATAAVTVQEERTKVQALCSDQSRKVFELEAVRIGGDIKPPKKLKVDNAWEFPELPPGTTASGIWNGEILIGPDGSVADTWAAREIHLDPPFPEFNEAIRSTISKWKYEPVVIDGKKMPVCMSVTVNVDFS